MLSWISEARNAPDGRLDASGGDADSAKPSPIFWVFPLAALTSIGGLILPERARFLVGAMALAILPGLPLAFAIHDLNHLGWIDVIPLGFVYTLTLVTVGMEAHPERRIGFHGSRGVITRCLGYLGLVIVQASTGSHHLWSDARLGPETRRGLSGRRGCLNLW